MTDTTPALMWFRDDLRLSDNPALTAAAQGGRPVIALYVLDEDSAGLRDMGGAARWWLAGSLRALGAALARSKVQLVLRQGPAARVVPEVARAAGCEVVAFNRRAGRAEARVDDEVEALLEKQGCAVERHLGQLLHQPGSVRTQAGGMPRTFSAFQRSALRDRPAPLPQRAPSLTGLKTRLESEDLDSWQLEPSKPDWAGGLRESWKPGEAAAHEVMSDFIDGGLSGYAEGRDRPDQIHVSRLSPYLRFGEISPRQALAAVLHAGEAGTAPMADARKFESELYWREFSYHLLHAVPDLARRNLQANFDAFPWRECSGDLKAWRRGLTGYPIVDAGMRQLWQTGWMHNRVRMIVASFLCKHLLLHWTEGESWFWDTLVDADPANNPASWQWVAGSGADAAPYFRIFNPVLQGEKFDPKGDYVRTYVPELAHLPRNLIHKPWEAGGLELAQAGVRLGITYPRPIVDHAAARDRALRAFEHTRKDTRAAG
ncbi:deoxyribodipyrimidine photo-lyase [Azorhizobium oxalatiphilum]|uniref:Deoxyribodipyrimidine photo-lyase n=1 Tax=Azorhizobium oxalatiphilum TaxID=980631 RepID=A0A917BSD2_9HYPH|nr:deoxyribodipyrimidine photo-lyase [Azorhizobium oxalatiphilum]GGF55634.1 deoxyribodipyrimidine photo-lyase [Azorhizobium oxalatiphilum]